MTDNITQISGALAEFRTVDAGIAELRAQRDELLAALEREAAAMRADERVRQSLAAITPTQVRELVLGMDSPAALLGAVSRIVLDPDLTCRLHYGLSVASPRGFGRWSHPTIVRLCAGF